MPEDPLKLREELEQLKKDIVQANHIKEVINAHNQELHKEEIGYIEAIPNYKKQAKDGEAQVAGVNNRIIVVNKELKLSVDELNKVKELSLQENRNLDNLKLTQSKIIEETKQINEQIKNKHEQLKQRELAVSDREKSCELREVGHKNKDMELDRQEIELNQRIKDHSCANEELKENIKSHIKDVESHSNNIAMFTEQKRFHAQDEELLKDKLAKADKFIKDNAELKSQLTTQIDRLNKQLQACDAKQKSLDRNIADLKNQENILKIKELRVNKLIQDKGIREELRQLEESSK